MPMINEDGRSGSGYDPKTRLDLPSITGDLDEPVTKRELSNIVRQIKEWSQRLQFGRVGFTVEMLPYGAAGTFTEQIAEFLRLVEDSHSFRMTNMPGEPLKIFQVPPGMGRVYNITYSLEFAIIEEIVETFTATGAMDTWVAPEMLNGEVTIVCRGSIGGNAPGPTDPGNGATVQATFSGISAGDTFDIFVGDDLSFPNGGDRGVFSVAGGYGGGASYVTPTGLPITDALIVAGGGGGAGAFGGGGVQTGDGGDGGYLTGGDGGDSGTGFVIGYGGKGATQTLPGAGGIISMLAQGPGEDGDTDGIGFGGDALPSPGSGTGGVGSGGGGGGKHGGGGASGQQAMGGGGSSWIKPGATNISHTDGSNAANGEITLIYTQTTPADPTDVTTAVWVAYAQWPDEQPYAHVVKVCGDNGDSPQGAAIALPLGEGDRIWMTWSNTNGDIGVLNWTFGMYSQGL